MSDLPLTEDRDDVAVIGMSCLFPGARGTTEFWRNLCHGVESVTNFSDEELESSGIDPTLLRDPNYVKSAPVLNDIDLFDASFFDFTSREAEITDPQQRIFLECAWEALEDAAFNPETFSGLVGVYASICANSYLMHNLASSPVVKAGARGFQLLIGNDKDYLATRVSYKFNLKGPSIVVQTACSSSLVAVHLACEGLIAGECDAALVGAVSIRVPQRSGYLYEVGAVGSPDGHCRPFDAQAQGTTFGSGVGVVVLKRLEDALADGDCVHAVIKGSAVNNDGSLKVGYTAPSVEGQAAVIAAALDIGGIDAESVTYVEAHGTGTPLGDPVEVAALTQAFRTQTQRNQFCAIGSVKSNIGHLDTAAGMAGLIKTILALKHKQLPPSINFHQPNPKINFESTPFYVNATLSDWSRGKTRRRAGVSSFGIGGTNAHVIVEEAPFVGPSEQTNRPQLLLLSAKTSSALNQMTSNFAERLRQQSEPNLADVGYTLLVGRKTFSHRRMLVCRSVDEAARLLETQDARRVVSAFQDKQRRRLIFMFPEDMDYTNIGRELYQEEPSFRDHFDRCAELANPYLSCSLHSILDPITRDKPEHVFTSFVLFALEYALAQMWRNWGLDPYALIGYGVGEYVAACFSDVLSLSDALFLVAAHTEIEGVDKRLKELKLQPPGIPFLSGITGTWITSSEAVDPGYWARRLRDPHGTRFDLPQVLQETDGVVLQIGSLSSRNEIESCLEALGQLWLAGVNVNWTKYYSGQRRRRMSLPTYPFDRKRYWIDPPRKPDEAPSVQQWSVKKPDLADWFYSPVWKQTVPLTRPAPVSDLTPQACYVVFVDPFGLGPKLARCLERQEQEVVEVTVGRQFEKKHRGAYVVNPLKRKDYDLLFKELSFLGHTVNVIVHFWGLGSLDWLNSSYEELKTEWFRFNSLLALAQALEGSGLDQALRLYVVSDKMQQVESTDSVDPEKSTILGPCRSIPHELPNVTCHSIDIIIPETGSAAEAQLLDQLVAEFSSPSAETTLAYRGHQRWVQFCDATPLHEGAGRCRLKSGGAYLITGGLGGLGLEFAEYLGRTMKARLVLVGRSQFPERKNWSEWLTAHGEEDPVSRKIRRLLAIENMGGEVLVVTADVTSASQIMMVAEQSLARFGELNGVIHAAGIPGSGPLRQQTSEAAANVLAPKIRGAQVLETIATTTPLDFFVLCSSLASITGGGGQMDYSAANAFLDAFAHQWTSSNCFTVSVNWGAWEDVGMTASASGNGQQLDHPLLTERLLETSDLAVFRTSMDAEHWALNEHRIFDKAVLPGTAFIEIIRAAMESFAGTEQIEIEDLFFLIPLAVESESREIYTVIKNEGTSFSVTVVSQFQSETDEAVWVELATAKVRALTSGPFQEQQMEDIEARCQAPEVVFAQEASDSRGDGSPFTFGPRWQVLEGVKVGRNEYLGCLQLPEEFQVDLEQYRLHPSLLDVATSFAIPRNGETYIPLSYERIKFSRPLTPKIFSHVTKRDNDNTSNETIDFDITILDQAGRVLVEIEYFRMKRLSRAFLQTEFSVSPKISDDRLRRQPRDQLYYDRLLANGRNRQPNSGGILPAEGTAALARILSSDLTQVIVSPKDIQLLIGQAPSFSISQLTQKLRMVKPASTPDHLRPQLNTPYIAPASDSQTKLATIWAQAFGVDQVGVDDNFFDLGGDSILAIQIVSSARRAGLELTPDQLFEHQTVRELAAIANHFPRQTEQSTN